MTSESEKFLKSKDIVDLCKVNFCISKLLIQCNTGSCCVHITGGVNMYLYLYLRLLVPVCPVCVCVWFQIRVLAETISFVKTFSKSNALLHRTHKLTSTSLGP